MRTHIVGISNFKLQNFRNTTIFITDIFSVSNVIKLGTVKMMLYDVSWFSV